MGLLLIFIASSDNPLPTSPCLQGEEQNGEGGVPWERTPTLWLRVLGIAALTPTYIAER